MRHLPNVIPAATDDPNNVTLQWQLAGSVRDLSEDLTAASGIRRWAGIMNQRFVKRETFFGGVDCDATSSILIPMSASTLYLGKNQDWLKATWQQYLAGYRRAGKSQFPEL